MDKFPHLAGQKPEYIQNQLDAFLTGDRSNDGGQMSSIVTELDPEDYAIVVAWFSKQSEPPATDTGAALVVSSGCLSCHFDTPNSTTPHRPAQHAGYLAKQMQDFRTGLRTHSPAATLHKDLLENLGDNIDDIAAYFASLERHK